MNLSEKERGILKIIIHINQIAPNPLNPEQLIDWTKSIDELKPELKLEDLKRVIDKMKLGDMEFDYRVGIQNIFLGLRSIERPMVY